MNLQNPTIQTPKLLPLPSGAVSPCSLGTTNATETAVFGPKTVPLVKQNPFSTKFIQSGAIPCYFPTEFQQQIQKKCAKFREYFFASLLEADHLWTNICLLHLADHLEQFRVSQIIGQHGTGKSTLVLAISEIFTKRGYKILHQSLHDRQRKLPHEFWTRFFLLQSTNSLKRLIIVDGYEQLGWLERLKLRWNCWKTTSRLLITTHQPISGIPILYKTTVSLEILEKILDFLDIPVDFVSEEKLVPLLSRCRNNLRNVLFALYDLYEERRKINSEIGSIDNNQSEKR